MSLPPVYLLGPASSPRRQAGERALRALGIHAECIDGIEASALEDESCWQRLLGEFPDLGAVDPAQVMLAAKGQPAVQGASLACYLGHLRCLRRIRDGGHDCALVLEDDARLDEGALAWLPALARSLGRWDVLRLHMGERALVYGPRLGRLDLPGKRVWAHQYFGGHAGAVALLYARSGVDKLLGMHRDINPRYRICFDGLFARWHKARPQTLRYAFVRPSLAWQDESQDSTIYAGVSNRQYRRNIEGWFSWRGRLRRLWERVVRRYGHKPLQLGGDIVALCQRALVSLLSHWRWRRQWREASGAHEASARPIARREGQEDSGG